MNKNVGIAILLLRLVLGATFLVHGIMKFQGGIDGTVAFFDSLGLPSVVAYATAIIELVGGAAMILGLGTRIVGALFAIVMVGAIVTAKWGAPFVGGYELDLVLLVLSAALALTGSPLASVDRMLGFSAKNKKAEA